MEFGANNTTCGSDGRKIPGDTNYHKVISEIQLLAHRGYPPFQLVK